MNQTSNSKTFTNLVINTEATAKNIAMYIKESNLKISQLQNLFGFEKPQAIYYWRDGKYLPSVDNLFKLAFFLNKSVNDIIVTETRENEAYEDVPERFRSKAVNAQEIK